MLGAGDGQRFSNQLSLKLNSKKTSPCQIMKTIGSKSYFKYIYIYIYIYTRFTFVNEFDWTNSK